ncbi:hypothetical protein [Methylorubrum aminovorans]|uniref:hypothetical protein n=1 Tax=Methylorubrum aminovorans TaxID=269069 RepID=UPI0024E09290|nr:hypothetical protein [Methylorubrum aminovorans]
MGNTNKSSVPALRRRDFILIDPERHVEWVRIGNQHAQQEGILGAYLLTVTQPSPRWFTDNGLEIPSDAVLSAFNAEGIAVLRQASVSNTLLYRPEIFAKFAVDAAIEETLRSALDSTPSITTGRSPDMTRSRFASVLTALDALTPDERSRLFRQAYYRSSASQINPGPFATLEREHTDVLTEALDKVWRNRRTELEERAAIPHKSNDKNPVNEQVEKYGFLVRLKSILR